MEALLFAIDGGCDTQCMKVIGGFLEHPLGLARTLHSPSYERSPQTVESPSVRDDSVPFGRTLNIIGEADTQRAGIRYATFVAQNEW